MYPTYANIGATIVHLFLATFLVEELEMGLLGVAISSSMQFMLRHFILVAFTKKFGILRDSVQPIFKKDTITNLVPQSYLSLQSCSLGVWGNWAFDVFTLIASY